MGLQRTLYSPYVREQVDVNQGLHLHQPMHNTKLADRQLTSISFRFAISRAVFTLPVLNAQSTSHLSNRVSAHLSKSGSVVSWKEDSALRCCSRSRRTSCVGLPEVECRSAS